ncbi:MAG: STM3941 family protein [Mucilaginibacter sp.]
MEQERFEFSPLKPILLLLIIPGIGLFLSDKYHLFILTHSVVAMILSLPFFITLWRYLSITFLMLLLKPAILLTDEKVVITYMGDAIDWKDVMDVYLASTRFTKSPNTYSIVIRVRNPEKYIKSIKNPITRYFRWYTRNLSDSPFTIDLSIVRGDEDEIYHTVLRYFQNNRGF